MILEIYPSRLKGRPLERHYFDGTLHDWMLLNVPDYKPGEDQPVSASVGGRILSPTEWQAEWAKGQVIEIRPLPREFASVAAIVAKVVVSALISMALSAIFGAKPKTPGTLPKPRDLAFADAKGNTARLNQVRPEIAGRHRVYPDYLCQPYKRFVDEHTQETRLMLCIGNGEFDVPEDEMKIGETPFANFDGLEYTVFAPGASVAGNLAHENWYNAPNIGPTLSGSSGIRLAPGVAGSTRSAATSYVITGSSIVIPTGGGALPQDWEVGTIVSVQEFTRTVSVVDGGGTWWSPSRDIVRCDLTGLDIGTGDVITMAGPDALAGRYRVHSLTAGVVVAGTASRIDAAIVSELDFDATPVTLYVAGQTVLLDDDYADADALVAAIDAQVGGVTVSHAAGVVTVTDDSPYDGQNITLSGNYAPIFGPTPYFVTGTASASYDEMTLDIWQDSTDTGEGEVTSGWVNAGSITPGEYAGVCLQKPRLKSTVAGPLGNTVDQYMPTEYRITDLVTGTLGDGTTGTVGLEFQRLDADGSDDATWAGFHPEVTTPNVEIALVSEVIGGWAGWHSAAPKGEAVTVFEYDLFAPSGIGRINREGKLRANKVVVEVQYRAPGLDQVSVVHSITRADQSPLGFTFSVTLPSAVQGLEVRARRIGAEPDDINYFSRMEWYGLRAKLPTVTSYAGVTTLALKVTGSESVSAQTNNQINLLVTRKLGGVAERGIVPWVKYVLDSIGIPSANIDSDEFERLHDLWVARGDYFDFVQLEQANVREVINRALGAGFAEVTLDGGLVHPVRDEARTVFEESYSAQNMTSPLRRSFQATRPDEFDGVDVTYLDPETYVEKTIQYRLPGDTGYKVETIRAEGVNDPTRAWRIAARRRREQKYRRWAYSWGTEMDALNSGYMSYCAVIDDVPGYGRSGWIKDAYLDGATCVLQVSEPFEFEVGQPHVVAWRDLEGSLVGPFSVSAGSNAYELIASTTTLPEFDDSAEPPHVYFGTTTRWRHPVLISKITPEGLTSCTVSAFNYDERVYADDDNSPD